MTYNGIYQTPRLLLYTDNPFELNGNFQIAYHLFSIGDKVSYLNKECKIVSKGVYILRSGETSFLPTYNLLDNLDNLFYNVLEEYIK